MCNLFKLSDDKVGTEETEHAKCRLEAVKVNEHLMNQLYQFVFFFCIR